MKITTKCRASRRLRFKDRKRIMPAEMHPKSFGTFEKQAPEPDLNSGSPFWCPDRLTKLLLSKRCKNIVLYPFKIRNLQTPFEDDSEI